jgi:hypothetical protein
MDRINGVLLQINNAIRLANSEYLVERRLAIVLFDQLIETQFQRFFDIALASSVSSFSKNKTQGQKRLRGKNKKFRDLASIVKKYGLINKEGFDFINYAHENIRNKAYHDPDSIDEELIEIGLMIYLHVIQNNRNIFRYTGPAIFLSGKGAKRIDFGQGVSTVDDLEEGLSSVRNYQKQAFEAILKNIRLAVNLPFKLELLLTRKIAEIEYKINELKGCIKYFNFYYILWGSYSFFSDRFFKYIEINRKPKNIDSIILLIL